MGKMIFAALCLASAALAGCAARESAQVSSEQISWNCDRIDPPSQGSQVQPPRAMDELLAAYEEIGRQHVKNSSLLTLSPRSTSSFRMASEVRQELREIAQEIIANGFDATEPLLEFLARELRQSRPETYGRDRLDFTRHVLNMLVTIGDPACVPFLLEILESPNVPENPESERAFPEARPNQSRAVLVQLAVLDALQHLTYLRFAGSDSSRGVERTSILVDCGQPQDEGPNFTEIAEAYRNIVDLLGLDRDEWHDHAVRAAHRMLQSEEIEVIHQAISFLQSPRDDNSRMAFVRGEMRDSEPLATLDRIAEIVPGLLSAITDEPQMKDPAFRPIRWLQALCAYGPHARPYVHILIQLHEAESSGESRSGGFRALGKVGGNEVMDHLAEQLPVIQTKAEAAAARADRLAGRRSDLREERRSQFRERTAWRSAEINLGLAFDRWTARHFETNEARLEWWKLNRELPEEDRMRANLPVLIEQASGEPDGSLRFGFILLLGTSLVPECVMGGLPLRIDLDCVQQNLERLQFDPSRGIFRLPRGHSRQCEME